MTTHQWTYHFLAVILSFIAVFMKLWSVSGLPAGWLPHYLHTLLHLSGESHVRCVATWRVLCYCREKHSRAILTPPQPYSPSSSPSLLLYSTERLTHHKHKVEKSKSTFLYGSNWGKKRKRSSDHTRRFKHKANWAQAALLWFGFDLQMLKQTETETTDTKCVQSSERWWDLKELHLKSFQMTLSKFRGNLVYH